MGQCLPPGHVSSLGLSPLICEPAKRQVRVWRSVVFNPTPGLHEELRGRGPDRQWLRAASPLYPLHRRASAWDAVTDGAPLLSPGISGSLKPFWFKLSTTLRSAPRKTPFLLSAFSPLPTPTPYTNAWHQSFQASDSRGEGRGRERTSSKKMTLFCSQWGSQK